MHNRILNSSKFWLILSILFIAVVYRQWFFTLNIFTWGDWGFYFSQTAREWLSLPRIWIDSYGLGMVDLGLSMYIPVRLLDGALSHFFDFTIFDRVVFLVPSVLIPTIGVFYLSKSVTKNSFASFIATLVYNLNTYILILNSGHMTLAVSFAFAPIIFLLFTKTLEKKSLKYAMVCGLVSFASSSYEIRAFYLTVLLIFIYFIYFLAVVNQSKINLKSLVKYGVLAATPIIIAITLNIYWLIGFVQTISSYSGIVFNRELYGIGHYPLQRVFTLSSPFWTGSHELAWGQLQNIPSYFWLIPIFILLGIWFGRKNKLIIYWTIVFLLGSFLTKLTGEPFTQVYQWLYTHVPGFNAFRESSKFDLLVSLSSSVLIANSITYVGRSKINKLFKIVLYSLPIVLFVYNAKPVFFGELGRMLTPRNIPQDYLTYKDFISTQKDYFRVLHVPTDSKWAVWDELHPKASLVNLVKGEWAIINNYTKTGLQYNSEEEIMGLLEKPQANELLDQSSIKYVVIPTIDTNNEDDFTFMYAPRTNFIAKLSKLRYLTPINIGTKELLIYENTGFLPQVFSKNGTSDIIFHKLSTTQYQVQIPAGFKDKLMFSQAFNSGWKIRIGNFSWWQSLLSKNYFQPSSANIQSSTGINEFSLPVSTGITPITIYFAPQAWVNLGSIISGSFLVIYLAFIWYLVRR